ncbi:MAG: hypothetical protein M3Y22_17170 [Pseudomonadota bacterium]|nr:hypothetical protein [Pseudomonadota bacterium]
MIDRETAERLRLLLSDLQAAIYNERGVPEPTQERLLNLISAEGFPLVDELEGVIR